MVFDRPSATTPPSVFSDEQFGEWQPVHNPHEGWQFEKLRDPLLGDTGESSWDPISISWNNLPYQSSPVNPPRSPTHPPWSGSIEHRERPPYPRREGPSAPNFSVSPARGESPPFTPPSVSPTLTYTHYPPPPREHESNYSLFHSQDSFPRSRADHSTGPPPGLSPPWGHGNRSTAYYREMNEENDPMYMPRTVSAEERRVRRLIQSCPDYSANPQFTPPPRYVRRTQTVTSQPQPNVYPHRFHEREPRHPESHDEWGP